MALALVFLGMLAGAMAASYWVVTGGSFLVAFAVYSLVATAMVLIAALAAFLWSEFRGEQPDHIGKALPAAE